LSPGRGLLAAVLALGIVSCAGKEGPPGGSGFIEATEATVSAEVAGQVRALRFDEGSALKSGDTLAEIDTLAVMLKLRQAEAGRDAADKRAGIAAIGIQQAAYDLELAGKEYERVKALVESGSVDQRRYDQVETAYRQAVLARRQADAALESARADLARAEADVGLLKKQAGDCFPRAPISGVVTSKFVQAGEWLAVGKPIVKIAMLDTVWVKIYVPAGDLARIRIAGRATVDPEGEAGADLEGRVTWISDEAEFTPKNVQTKEARADLVYAVKVTIPNAAHLLKVGMPATVKIE
jgi:HlyD family secretion protein